MGLSELEVSNQDLFQVVKDQLGNDNLPRLIEKITTRGYSARMLRKNLSGIVGDRSDFPDDPIMLEFVYKYVVQEVYRAHVENEVFDQEAIYNTACKNARSFLEEWRPIILSNTASHNEEGERKRKGGAYERALDLVEKNKDQSRDEIIQILCNELDISENTAAVYFGRANKELGKPVKTRRGAKSKKPQSQENKEESQTEEKPKKKSRKTALDTVIEVVQNHPDLNRGELTDMLENQYGMARNTAYQYIGKAYKKINNS